MTLVRLRATITWEYDADPEDYGTDDPVEIARMDQRPDCMVESAALEDHVEFTVVPVV